jgi:hypothetical protein
MIAAGYDKRIYLDTSVISALFDERAGGYLSSPLLIHHLCNILIEREHFF